MNTPERSIGLVGATAIGVGGMVGGGIFAVLGVAATDAAGATPIAFLVGGIVAALTAYSYARLSVAFQSAGGTVTFVDRVFGVRDVTGSLNIVLWVGYITTTALYASAFGNYAATLFPGGTDPNAFLLRGLVVMGVAIPWFINLADASVVSRSEGYVVAIKLTILLVVVGAGVPTVDPTRLAIDTWPSPLAIIGAGMLIFVAYEGFELIANASAEIKRPVHNLPRAFALSVGLVIILYITIAIVVVGSLTPDEIARSADFALAEAAQASLGQFGFSLVAVAAVLATFSAINATLYGSARLSFTIASEGELPALLETRTWNQPVGLHITALIGATLAVALPLSSISGLASIIFLAVFAVVNAASIRHKGSSAFQKTVGACGLIGCIAALAILVAQSVINDPTTIAILATMLVAALATEHLFLKHHRKV